MKTKQEQIEKMMRDVPQTIVAYDANPKGQHLYGEQRLQIAEILYDKGYGDVSEYKAEIERLRQEVRNTDKMARNTIEQYRAENKELATALKQSEDNYSRAFERLKTQQQEIDKLKAETIKLLKTRLNSIYGAKREYLPSDLYGQEVISEYLKQQREEDNNDERRD